MKSKITIVSRFCVLTLMVAALSVAGVALAQDAPAAKSSALSVKDKTFMKKAAKGGMMEVTMGNLAAQNGQSDDVKSFASQKGVTLPAKEPTLKWNSDKAYINMMVKDHEKDLTEFQEEAKTGSDPEVKKFAEDTAKMVQEHLDLAKETQSKLQ